MFLGDVEEIPDADWDRLQELIARFETAWARGERPKIADYLPADEPHREALLLELVHGELEFRLKAGESARVEDYLRRHPSLKLNPEAVLGLIRAEWSLRRRREPRLTLDRFRSRFPDYADALESGGPDGGSTLAAPIGSGRSEIRPPAAIEGALPRRLGKFELRQRVGAGSFGVVYRAWDTVMNREVALKLPRPEAVAAPADLRAFLREARNAKDLHHPNIVEILDAGPIEGTVCVVRAFVEGTTLAERLKEASVTPEEAAALMILVAEALDHAHHRGIIHRDLKPSNILLDLEGRPHISDFGLAKRESGETTLSPSGQLGTMIGTPAYMSPEQSRGQAHHVDPRSDVYSAGVVLYEALTGSIPFRGRGRMLQVQIQGAQPAPLRSLNDDVPRDLETICLRAMAKVPSDRYPTAQALADDLKNFLRGRPVGPRPEAIPRAAPEPRSRSLVAGVAGFLIGAAVASSIAIVAVGHRRDHARSIARAVESLERLEELPYSPGLDAPEAHRRVLDAIRRQSAAWLDSIASDGDPELRETLARSFARMADRESGLGSDREAARLWSRAIVLAEAVASEAPADPSRLEALARALSGLAEVRGRLGDREESTRLFDRSLRRWEQVREWRRLWAEERPADVDALLGRAEAEAETSRIKLSLGREADFDETERLVGRAARQSSPGSAERGRLARLCLALARSQIDTRQPDKALRTAFRGNLLREQAPSEPGAAADLAHFRLIAGSASRQLGRIPEALDDFRRASERFETLAIEDPIAVDFRRDLGRSRFEIGRVLLEQPGRLDEAIETFREALLIQQALRRAHPESHAELAALAETRQALGIALQRKGHLVASAVNDLQGIACGAGAVALAPGVESYRRDLIRHVDALAERARSPLGGPAAGVGKRRSEAERSPSR